MSMTNNREAINMSIDSLIETVSNRNMSESSILNMSVWDILSTMKDDFKVVYSEYTYHGEQGHVYRLHMNKHVGKEIFKKLIKSPLIGGWKGTAYNRNAKAFTLYDNNVRTECIRIVGLVEE